MIQKIRYIVCHPSMLGLYLKNKFSTVLGYWFAFFLVTILVLAAKDMHAPTYDRNLAKEITEMVYYDEDLSDVVYKDGKFSGSTKKITGYVDVYFNYLSYPYADMSDSLMMVFYSDNVAYYYASIELGRITYKDYGFDSFSFSDLKAGDVDGRIQFQNLILEVLKDADSNYRALYYFIDVANILVLYFITLLVAYFVAYMVNPPIERSIRFKLVGYDSLCFFVISWVSVLFSISWLQYVACILPVFYVVRTFSRIKKIFVKKGGNSNDN